MRPRTRRPTPPRRHDRNDARLDACLDPMTDDTRDIWEVQRATLGALIRSQRQLADLSLRQVAEAADISNAYLSQVERGIHEPSVRVLRGISDALGVSMDVFLHQAGMTDERNTACTVEEAINGDADLSAAQKRALIAVYNSYVEEVRSP